MRALRRSNSILALIGVLIFANSAFAEWESVGQLDSPVELQDNQKCQFRVKLTYANPALQENYYYPSRIKEFVDDSGEVSSTMLQSDINFSEVLSFASAGVFSGNLTVSEVVDLYEGPEKPFDERLRVILSSGQVGVAVVYQFFNQDQGGTIFSSTRALRGEMFELQVNCGPARPGCGPKFHHPHWR